MISFNRWQRLALRMSAAVGLLYFATLLIYLSLDAPTYPTTFPVQTPTQIPTQSYTILPRDTPQHVPKAGKYVRVGCYTDSNSTRALTGSVHKNYEIMAPFICSDDCDGTPFIGVENGGECYCGNTINFNGTLVDDSECNTPCGNYAGTYCGGVLHLDLYYDPSVPG